MEQITLQMPQDLILLLSWFIPLIITLLVWDTAWRAVALWKAARNNHLVWFVCLVVFNTAGILPIIYILLDIQKKKEKAN